MEQLTNHLSSTIVSDLKEISKSTKSLMKQMRHLEDKCHAIEPELSEGPNKNSISEVMGLLVKYDCNLENMKEDIATLIKERIKVEQAQFHESYY